MDTKATKTAPNVTDSHDERVLSKYSARDRKLIEDVMEQHPGLTVAEAIEALTSGGGL